MSTAKAALSTIYLKGKAKLNRKELFKYLDKSLKDSESSGSITSCIET
jgi:hypothetical protein